MFTSQEKKERKTSVELAVVVAVHCCVAASAK